MKYFIILGIGLIIIIAIIFILVRTKKKTVDIPKKDNVQNTDSYNDEVPYSGDLYEIRSDNYNRLILVKNATEKYLTDMITEFGELSGNEEYQIHSFWFSKSGDWMIIKIGSTVDFFTYHNLACWFSGYKKSPASPDFSIGLAHHKTDSTLDYIFYLDPHIQYGDTEIGAFRKGDSFFIYLPGAYEEHGNLTVTTDIRVSFNETIELILKNGLDILILDSLDFVEHRIKMHE